MNTHIRDVLRESGARAGRQARADAGLPEHVEDHKTLVKMAEMMIKVASRRDER
jgi:hypothetical protein